jgi:dTDP-4-amino-4,6-dideoxygalactose transaminase
VINWWETSFGELEIQRISESIRHKNVSQGVVTKGFEDAIADFLGVTHVVAVSNGSCALLCALMAVGVGPGDEVIVPNRTWISTAHAVAVLGAKVLVVDVEADRPIIDVTRIEAAITSRTKAIIPVHMNGRAADLGAIQQIATRHKLAVIEDAAQALGSRNRLGYLGTQSDIGCFSLSVAKTISTGQGGFIVTNNDQLAEKLRAIRTHGVESTKDPESWVRLGFNFRFTDVLASIGVEQLKLLPERISHLKAIYQRYADGLNGSLFKLIPVDLEAGEVPVYNEFLVENRQDWINRLSSNGIETRPFYPDINQASYLGAPRSIFSNSHKFSKQGIYLPSGPSQTLGSIHQVIKTIKDGC